MASETLVYTPENGGTVPAWMAMNGGNWGNGLFGGAGGSAFLGALLGSFFPNLFGGWNNGLGGGAYGSGAAASLGAQATANNNTELIMNAINGTDADVRALANANNVDFNAVKSELNSLQSALASVGAQVGMSGLQVINAIQSGNSAMASSLCQCCCDMKQLVTTQGYENQIATLNQTNALSNAITGGNQRIVDAIADLKTTTIAEFCAAKERDMQADINNKAETITQLRSQIDNANQSAMFNSAFNVLNGKITELAAKTPQTVPVQWPQLTAISTTPNIGWGNGFNGWGYGFGGQSYWG